MTVGETLNVGAVSIDVTGTMIHSPQLAEIYSAVLSRHGAEIPAERLRELIPTVWQEFSCRASEGRDRFADHPEGDRGWWEDYMERICDLGEVESPGPFAAAELYDRFAQADAWAIYDDVLPALAALAEAGFRLIVTSNWDPRLPSILDRLDLTRWFEAIVYSGEVGFEKPHQQIFRSTLEELDLPPAAVVHVGDRRLDDVEGPQAVGMPALLIDRRRDRGDLADLRELLDRLRLVESVLS
jgi:REG-2-like HAD superfamily hydrolase